MVPAFLLNGLGHNEEKHQKKQAEGRKRRKPVDEGVRRYVDKTGPMTHKAWTANQID